MAKNKTPVVVGTEEEVVTPVVLSPDMEDLEVVVTDEGEPEVEALEITPAVNTAMEAINLAIEASRGHVLESQIISHLESAKTFAKY